MTSPTSTRAEERNSKSACVKKKKKNKTKKQAAKPGLNTQMSILLDIVYTLFSIELAFHLFVNVQLLFVTKRYSLVQFIFLYGTLIR